LTPSNGVAVKRCIIKHGYILERTCSVTNGSEPSQTERVTCEVCLREIPRSEAVVPAVLDYVAYFCGLDCYEKWKGRNADEGAAPARPVQAVEPAAPPPEIQLGRGRGRAKDERIKRLIKQHPQRDEPVLDSVEPDETPPS
jgi:hypothetical protein